MGLARVGFDGAAGSSAALRWAIGAASWHGYEIEALTVVAEDPSGVARAERVQARLEEVRATAAAPGARTVAVHGRVVRGDVVEGLVDAAPPAELLVIGGHGRGMVAGLLLGSASQRVVERAHGPVVVVGEDAPDVEVERLVVGVDGSGHAARALRWAVDEARVRGAVLEVVASFQPAGMPPGVPWVPDLGLSEVADDRAAAQAGIDRQLRAVDSTGVSVEWSVIEAPPHEALCGRAADAQLLVVGSRGLGSVRSLLLRSTGHRCLHDAPTPVVVVP